MHDWQWGMPTENWGQTGSYIGPALPPLEDPDAGVLVQLPCINRDYLPLLLGCCDQLRNPSSWDPSIGDNGLSLVLNKWSKLRQMLGAAIGVPCVPPVQYRFTADCHLQTSSDGGATWVTVPGWDANLDSCIKAHIPPQMPPNPRGLTSNQQACNIAGHLANELLQQTMAAVARHYAQQNGSYQVAQDIAQSLAGAFPLTYGAIQAFGRFYDSVIQQLLVEVQATRDDVNLWSLLTCTIYGVIHADGQVDSANFTPVHDAIAALVYPLHQWAIPAVAAFWNDLGLGNIQAIQASGALTDEDCSGCGATGPWCRYYDFTASNQNWNAEPGNGAYVNSLHGTMWYSQDVGGNRKIHLYKTFSHLVAVTNVAVLIGCTENRGGHDRSCYNQNPCGVANLSNVPFNVDLPVGYFTWVDLPNPLTGSADCTKIYWDSDATNGQATAIAAVQLRGVGPPPQDGAGCVR